MYEGRLHSKIEQLEQMLDSMYRPLIDLHKDKRLRSFAQTYGPFEVYKSSDYNHDRLAYDENGFVFKTAETQGSYGDIGRLVSHSANYEVKFGKLYARNMQGREQDMFARFPKLNVSLVESGLEKAIDKVQEKYMRK